MIYNGKNGKTVEDMKTIVHQIINDHIAYPYFATKTIMNLSDDRNNDTCIQKPFDTFDARSASVFMGAGRQFSVSLKIVIN
jgi:hypothetical protein